MGDHTNAERARRLAHATRVGDAAGDGCVGLEHVELSAAHRVDRVVQPVEVLAVGDRDRRAGDERLDAGAFALGQRLFEPADAEGRQRVRQRARRGQCVGLAGVDHQFDVVTEQTSEFGERGDVVLPVRAGADLDLAHAAVEQRGEDRQVVIGRPLLQERGRRVDLDAVAQPPDHRTDRPSVGLADEVPQRDLDRRPGLRPDPLLAEPPAGEQAQSLAERVDGDELLTHEQRGEHVVDRGGDDRCVRAAVAVAGLTPADRAVVRGDLHVEERHLFAVGAVRAGDGLDLRDRARQRSP